MFARSASSFTRSAFQRSGARFASTHASAATTAAAPATGRWAAAVLGGVGSVAYLASRPDMMLHLDSRGDYGARLGKYSAESQGSSWFGPRQKWSDRIGKPKEKPAATEPDEHVPGISALPKRAAWHTRLGLVPGDGTIVVTSTATVSDDAEPDEDLDVTGLLEEVAAILASPEEPLPFDSDTREVNWESPKLVVKAEGPCASQFKTAFSCFATSETVPPGEDCIDAFKATQKCLLHDEATDAANELEEDTD